MCSHLVATASPAHVPLVCLFQRNDTETSLDGAYVISVVWVLVCLQSSSYWNLNPKVMVLRVATCRKWFSHNGLSLTDGISVLKEPSWVFLHSSSTIWASSIQPFCLVRPWQQGTIFRGERKSWGDTGATGTSRLNLPNPETMGNTALLLKNDTVR